MGAKKTQASTQIETKCFSTRAVKMRKKRRPYPMPSMLATSTTTCLLPRPTVTNPQIDRPGTSTRTRPLHPTPPIIQIILPGLNILMDPLRYSDKSSLDIIPTLRARLDVLQDAIGSTPLLGLFTGDLSLVLRIAGRDGRGRGEV